MLLSWLVIFYRWRNLETPGEDPNSKQAEQARKKFKLGAYPVKEF
ncbi:MAG: hypothetical protein Ct9H300mP5_1230 [Candidatus Pelagibacterales bacterium]|nr:MAG: hypothetical protein Ct9H300mP5_1230 [Pelagibacterales bacterium]